jgi:preprotein translocase subunit YajC
MVALLLLAYEDKPPVAPGGAPPTWELPLILMLIFFAFYFIVIRPSQRRQERERLALLNSLKKNDKVLTSGGIYGTIVSISDKEDEVIVKVDDNTRLKMLKSSILRNLTQEEAARAEKELKDKK